MTICELACHGYMTHPIERNSVNTCIHVIVPCSTCRRSTIGTKYSCSAVTVDKQRQQQDILLFLPPAYRYPLSNTTTTSSNMNSSSNNITVTANIAPYKEQDQQPLPQQQQVEMQLPFIEYNVERPQLNTDTSTQILHRTIQTRRSFRRREQRQLKVRLVEVFTISSMMFVIYVTVSSLFIVTTIIKNTEAAITPTETIQVPVVRKQLIRRGQQQRRKTIVKGLSSSSSSSTSSSLSSSSSYNHMRNLNNQGTDFSKSSHAILPSSHGSLENVRDLSGLDDNDNAGVPKPPASSPIDDADNKSNDSKQPRTKGNDDENSVDPKDKGTKGSHKDTKKRVIPLAKFSIELGTHKQEKPQPPPQRTKDDNNDLRRLDSTKTAIAIHPITSPASISHEVNLTLAIVEKAIEGYLTKEMGITNGDILVLTGTEAPEATEAIDRYDLVVHRYHFDGTVTLSSNDTTSNTISGTTSTTIEQSILWRRQKAALVDLRNDLEGSINDALQQEYIDTFLSSNITYNASNSNSHNSSINGNGKNTTFNHNASSSLFPDNTGLVTDDGNTTLPSYEAVQVVGIKVENILDNSGRGGGTGTGSRYPNDTSNDNNVDNTQGTGTSSGGETWYQSKSNASMVMYIIAAAITIAASGTLLFCFFIRRRATVTSKNSPENIIVAAADDDVDGAMYVGRSTSQTTIVGKGTGEISKEQKKQQFWAAMSHGRKIGGTSRPGGGHLHQISSSKIQQTKSTSSDDSNGTGTIIGSIGIDATNNEFVDIDLKGEKTTKSKQGRRTTENRSSDVDDDNIVHAQSSINVRGNSNDTTGSNNKKSQKSKKSTKLPVRKGYLQ